MKKLISIYKPYLFRPILYKTVTRGSVTAAVCLLWERFVSDGHFTLWEAPGFLCGAVLLGWAWLEYLRLDGLRFQLIPGRKKDKPNRHPGSRSIVDYADEKIVSFEELEPEERQFCSMVSCLVLGVPLVLIGVLAGAL